MLVEPHPVIDLERLTTEELLTLRALHEKARGGGGLALPPPGNMWTRNRQRARVTSSRSASIILAVRAGRDPSVTCSEDA